MAQKHFYLRPDPSKHFAFYRRYTKNYEYIELACLVDVTGLEVDKSTDRFEHKNGSNKCELIGDMFYKNYSVKSEPLLEGLPSEATVRFYNQFRPIYSHRYLDVSYRYRKNRGESRPNFFNSKWVHIYGGKKFLPVPKSTAEWALGMQECRTKDSPKVHLSIKYGSRVIEDLCIEEFENIRKGKILSTPKAEGL